MNPTFLLLSNHGGADENPPRHGCWEAEMSDCRIPRGFLLKIASLNGTQKCRIHNVILHILRMMVKILWGIRKILRLTTRKCRIPTVISHIKWSNANIIMCFWTSRTQDVGVSSLNRMKHISKWHANESICELTSGIRHFGSDMCKNIMILPIGQLM